MTGQPHGALHIARQRWYEALSAGGRYVPGCAVPDDPPGSRRAAVGWSLPSGRVVRCRRPSEQPGNRFPQHALAARKHPNSGRGAQLVQPFSSPVGLDKSGVCGGRAYWVRSWGADRCSGGADLEPAQRPSVG